MEEFASVESIDRVHDHLKAASKNNNIVEELRLCLSSWDYKSTSSLNDFKEDIQQVTEELIDLLFSNYIGTTSISDLIGEFVHFEIYDTVLSRLKETFTKDDLAVYEKSKDFCKNNGSPKQLGATFYNFIPNAAVVELSMLNNKRTPIAKLKCLQSTYDNIFAEVKGALISVISKYSEKEIDLPSINNKDVVPIVMSVIFKSKLFYFISDMSYIREFGADILKESRNLREIYQVFEKSLKNILHLHLNSNTEELTFEKLDNKLSVCGTINFIETQNKESSNNKSVFNEEKKRLARLITSATTENLDKYS